MPGDVQFGDHVGGGPATLTAAYGLYINVDSLDKVVAAFKQALTERPDHVIQMPCGVALALAEVPLVTTPCPCGDPKHWLVYVNAQAGKS